jgi:hypothetical protein
MVSNSGKLPTSLWRGRRMINPYVLPPDLPRAVDDGAWSHRVGTMMPKNRFCLEYGSEASHIQETISRTSCRFNPPQRH